MGLIREPENIDFEVSPRRISEKEKSEISKVIAHYKRTGEIIKLDLAKKKGKEEKQIV